METRDLINGIYACNDILRNESSTFGKSEIECIMLRLIKELGRRVMVVEANDENQ